MHTQTTPTYVRSDEGTVGTVDFSIRVHVFHEHVRRVAHNMFQWHLGPADRCVENQCVVKVETEVQWGQNTSACRRILQPVAPAYFEERALTARTNHSVAELSSGKNCAENPVSCKAVTTFASTTRRQWTQMEGAKLRKAVGARGDQGTYAGHVWWGTFTVPTLLIQRHCSSFSTPVNP